MDTADKAMLQQVGKPLCSPNPLLHSHSRLNSSVAPLSIPTVSEERMVFILTCKPPYFPWTMSRTFFPEGAKLGAVLVQSYVDTN